MEALVSVLLSCPDSLLPPPSPFPPLLFTDPPSRDDVPSTVPSARAPEFIRGRIRKLCPDRVSWGRCGNKQTVTVQRQYRAPRAPAEMSTGSSESPQEDPWPSGCLAGSPRLPNRSQGCWGGAAPAPPAASPACAAVSQEPRLPACSPRTNHRHPSHCGTARLSRPAHALAGFPPLPPPPLSPGALLAPRLPRPRLLLARGSWLPDLASAAPAAAAGGRPRGCGWLPCWRGALAELQCSFASGRLPGERGETEMVK